jgi:hypothetical protein
MRTARRRALPAAGVALGLLTGLNVVAAAPAEAAPSGATTAEDVALVTAFYRSKESLPSSGTASKQVLALARIPVTAAAVGNTYFTDFATSYADDPDVQVRGLEVDAAVLGKTTVGSRIQYRVSVTVDFQLYDTYNKRPFTGGETVDHLLTAAAPAAQALAATSALPAISSDVALAVSTAPVEDDPVDAGGQPGDTAPAYTVPKWQVDRKRVLSASAAKVAAASSAYPSLNYSRMATYAYYWTEPKRAKSINALKYGRSAGDDCTNFVSQALNDGGWPIRDTTRKHRANLDYWDYNMTGPGRFTYSWSRAEESYRRVHDKAGKQTFSKLGDAWLADLVYADWNVGDATYGDGVKDHAMIVSTVTKTRPYFSQKSGNRHNVSAAEVVKNTKAGGGTKWKWYGLRT